jgi:class 3 adenylate cyclase/tetratricopeptide (TPR) repeat protein
MTCPRCQAQVREGVRFCEECGARLAQACPRCGSPISPEKKFCGSCGTPLAPQAAERFTSPQAYTPKHLADKILTSRSALEGERKQVTVLFADLKGSMELLADRDPEEARKILDPVLERMMEAVHLYEGTVNQVMGDGIMALFGAPVAHEDHAVRACYAAVRMQEAVTVYGDEVQRAHGIPVQIRVGLNSGGVVVRSIGNDLRLDYSAVGQTTHLAARMEQMAKPGSILITGSTYKLAEGYIDVKPLGPVPVRGLEAPVDVHELVGAAQTRSRIQVAVTRGVTPFVGREANIERLRELLAPAGAGRGQVVAIVGEPGVGKSRLVWEFANSPSREGWLVLESAALAYQKSSPYRPLIEMLKQSFRIDDRDDERRVREKLTKRLVTTDETLAPTMPAFLALLDLRVEDPAWQALDPQQRRQRTMDALKRLMLRASQRQPLLLVLENLHWIDSETQAFLDSVVDSLPTARLLLLVTYRPEYTHGWGSKTYYTRIGLDRLPQSSAEQLLRAVLGDAAELRPLQRLLTDRTEGNPFFLEESARTLVESGVLVGERGSYRLAKPLESIQVPATVQAVLAARIDRLAPEEKRLLQTAAVIGKDVPLMLLRAIADLPDEELREGLTRLQASEFLYETRLFPEIEYTFKHGLTHEVAYESLLQERRRTVHASIVETVERLYADRLGEHVERLAHHAFRGDRWEQAVDYLRRAGAKAAVRAANPEAVACLEQALAALKRLPERRETLEQAIDLRLDLRPPLLQLGRLEQVFSLSKEAERLAQALGDQPRLAGVYTYLINYHYLKGEPDLAIEYGERSLAIGAAGHDLALQALARGYMGYSYHAQGRYRQAEYIFRQNIDALEPSLGSDAAPQVQTSYIASSGWLAFTLAELGDFDLAQTYLDMAQRAAETAGHAYGQTIAWTLTGLVALRQGRLDRAVQPLERSLEACMDKQLAVWRPIPSSLLGLTSVLLGRVEAGLPLLEDGVELSKALGVNAYLALWTAQLGEGLLAAGQIEQAGAVAQRARELALAHKERGHEAWALHLLAEVTLKHDRSDIEKAAHYYGQAIALAEELGMRPLLARIDLGLGQLHRRVGNHVRAEEYLASATVLLREMDMTLWLERAEAEIREYGRLLIVGRNQPALYEHLMRAFSGDARVTVVLDRRSGERRQQATPSGMERRRADRRRQRSDEAVRAGGFRIVIEA